MAPQPVSVASIIRADSESAVMPRSSERNLSLATLPVVDYMGSTITAATGDPEDLCDLRADLTFSRTEDSF